MKNTKPRTYCESCTYFNEQVHIHETDIGRGRCHRYPPVFTESSSGDKAHHWQFPLVQIDNWCGEYAARSTVTSADAANP